MSVDGVSHKLILLDCVSPNNVDRLLNTANAFLFLFDLSNRKTYQSLQSSLLGQFVASRGHESNVPVAICAHKSDLAHTRTVSSAEAIKLAKELQSLCKGSVAVFETSVIGNTSINPPVSDSFLNVLQYRCQKASMEEEGSSCNIA